LLSIEPKRDKKKQFIFLYSYAYIKTVGRNVQ